MSLQRPNKMQEAFSAIKPVRPFARFSPVKVANTGVDSLGAYKAFLEKDTITNIDVRRDHHKRTIHDTTVKIPPGQVPVGTTKETYKKGLTNDAKLDREGLGISPRVFPRNPTNNISAEAPDNNRRFQSVYDSMIVRPRYAKNHESTEAWQPRSISQFSINNRSGSTFDIISHSPLKYQAHKQLSILDE